MSQKLSASTAKLTLKIDVDGKGTMERVIVGAGQIRYILEEAGIFDDELMAHLGYYN